MTQRPSFACEPWAVREVGLDLEQLGQTESIFALSNGHIGWRANLDEGEPHVLLGSYLNAFYEEIPLPYAETAYGYPEAGQTIVNVTDGKIIRLLVDDEAVDRRNRDRRLRAPGFPFPRHFLFPRGRAADGGGGHGRKSVSARSADRTARNQGLVAAVWELSRAVGCSG